jgi:hypothetical protein
VKHGRQGRINPGLEKQNNPPNAHRPPRSGRDEDQQQSTQGGRLQNNNSIGKIGGGNTPPLRPIHGPGPQGIPLIAPRWATKRGKASVNDPGQSSRCSAPLVEGLQRFRAEPAPDLIRVDTSSREENEI